MWIHLTLDAAVAFGVLAISRCRPAARYLARCGNPTVDGRRTPNDHTGGTP